MELQLGKDGLIRCGEYVAMPTRDGRWSVSRKGTPIGEADNLTEIPALIQRREADVRARLARVTAEAQARAEAERREREEIARATKRD